MIAILMINAHTIYKVSGKKPALAIDKSNPIDLRVTYSNGERIATPVESK